MISTALTVNGFPHRQSAPSYGKPEAAGQFMDVQMARARHQKKKKKRKAAHGFM